jgi:hypothetical protein
LATLSSKCLILFDENNIEIFKISKKKIKVLSKSVEESEVWIDTLD